MSILKDLVHSKKFIALATGVLVMILHQYLGIDQETAMKIAAMVSAYVLGQGISDGLSGGMTSSQPGTPSAANLPRSQETPAPNG